MNQTNRAARLRHVMQAMERLGRTDRAADAEIRSDVQLTAAAAEVDPDLFLAGHVAVNATAGSVEDAATANDWTTRLRSHYDSGRRSPKSSVHSNEGTTFTTVSFTPDGLDSRPATVLVRRRDANSRLTVTGPDGQDLPDTRDRVYAGINNSCIRWSRQQLTITITPPGPALRTTHTDLAIAAGILAATGELPLHALTETVLLGEVGLDGAIRAVESVLSLVGAAAEAGHRIVVVPAGNAREATLVPGVQVVAVSSLSELIGWAFTGVRPPLPAPAAQEAAGEPSLILDLAQLPTGLRSARYALEVAAAGRHSLSVTGPPGTATSQLARCLPLLLPDLDDRAALQVSAVHAAAGHVPPSLMRRPPFQAPHPRSSLTTLIGGHRPGSVSLAHHGVLLLEDAPEFEQRTLESLRQLIDSGVVQLARADHTVTYPAQFQLVLTARPCPCTTWDTDETCGTCTRPARRRYQARISGLGSRIDVVLALDSAGRSDAVPHESSAEVAARVEAARAAAAERWEGMDQKVNAAVPLDLLRRGKYRLPASATSGARRLLDQGGINEPGYGRLLRLAWTISDLRGIGRPDLEAVTAAIDLSSRST